MLTALLFAAALAALPVPRPLQGCPPVPMAFPNTGCALGTATASVPPVEGATYLWSTEGAVVTAGQGTRAVTLLLHSGSTAKLSVTVSTSECARVSTGAISIRQPLAAELKVPAAVEGGQSVTVEWSYAHGAQPLSQTLRGSAFAAPVMVPPEARGYTFTPSSEGSNTIELVASYGPPPASAPGGKRRAAGSTVGASICGDARVTREFQVVGCNRIAPLISLSPEVEAGTIVTAGIPLTPADSAKWFVEGGAFVGGDEGAEVRILVNEISGGDLNVRARVATGASCAVESTAHAAIKARAVCPSNTPTATVTLHSRGCTTANVQATFTGTPPFRGAWSDGTRFETSQTTLMREFTTTGTYTIGDFSDARCRGTVNTTAQLASFFPTAVLTSDEACTGTTVRATISGGTPPYRGRFYPGDWFNTNENTLSLVLTPEWTWSQIEHLIDANCPDGVNGSSSNRIQLQSRRHAWMEPSNVVCASETPGHIVVHFPATYPSNGEPPYTVEWSDGVISTGSEFNWVSREVTTTEWSGTLEVVRAYDGSCDVVMADRSVDISYRPKPRIDTTDLGTCTDTPIKVKLQPLTLHPDTILNWTATDADIVSIEPDGVTVANVKPGWTSRIRVTATFPDGGCPQGWSEDVALYGSTEALATDLKVVPSSIKPGGTATVSFKRVGEVTSWTLKTADPARWNDLDLPNGRCVDGICSYTYKDTKGAGDVTIELFWHSDCDPANPPLTVPLKIAP